MAEKVYCLYRVSTSKQVDHDDQNQADIPMQRKACHDFADKMGWIIVGEEKETGVSGYKVSADDRDKLQLIKKYAEQGKFDILLVFMFDRLGRKSDETPFVVEWFAKKGVRVWSVKEGEQRFESHTDRLTNYIRFWQADGESQKTSMRTKTALGQMVEEGRFRGGNAPYGYRLEKSGILNKRKHEVYMLVIDEDEARVVRMMFDLCVSSGYGRWRLANFLNDHGIKNRKGQNWHDASVGGILHNPLYKGILRSGETYAGPFDELQIIALDHFDLAQKLMLERTNERKEHRTVPLNTTGQSLLSGNIFCGHCGGRLVLTTNGKTVRRADGTAVYKKRIRYVCYNKTRRRQECTGQTGYTMHIVDGIVTEVLHQVFNKMQGASGDMIVGSAVQKQMAMIRSELQRARAENTKANKEYESLKAEVGPGPGAQELGPDDVPGHLLQRQAVPLIHCKQERREHHPQHEKQAAGVADGPSRQQIGRDAHRCPAAKTDELALGEIKGNLGFDFGKVVWYVFIGNFNHLQFGTKCPKGPPRAPPRCPTHPSRALTAGRTVPHGVHRP